MNGRCRGDAGQVTAMWVVLATALMVLGAVVYGGGQILAGRREANNLALQSARAGAQSVDERTFRSGNGAVTLNQGQAEAAARSYLSSQGITNPQVSVAGDQVTVTITITQPTPILGIIGMPSRTVTATQSARAQHGPGGTG